MRVIYLGLPHAAIVELDKLDLTDYFLKWTTDK